MHAATPTHAGPSFHLQTYNNDKKMNNHVISNVQQQQSDPVALLSTRVEENDAGDDEPDAGNLHERHRLCARRDGLGGGSFQLSYWRTRETGSDGRR